jgi:hypothetical protein
MLSGHDRSVSTVVMRAVVSVDGFIADASDDVGPLFEWYFNGDAEIVDGGPFNIASSRCPEHVGRCAPAGPLGFRCRGRPGSSGARGRR